MYVLVSDDPKFLGGGIRSARPGAQSRGSMYTAGRLVTACIIYVVVAIERLCTLKICSSFSYVKIVTCIQLDTSTE